MRIQKIVSLFLSVSLIWWSLSFAAPEGGVVVGGSAGISQNGTTTTINQTTQNAVINWQSFNTASNEAVNFIQPNATSAVLNRINSGLPTQFFGSLTANGRVFIVNPSGIFFGASSRIDVGGILATTADIQNQNFMNANYQFQQKAGSSNSVVNEGEIKANGFVGLVAPGVMNNGVIRANVGKVVLASGTAYALDMYGDQLIQFATNSQVTQTPIGPDGKPMKSAVMNNGSIYADGGQVLLTANVAANLVENMIDSRGYIQAKSAYVGRDGSVVLSGGNNGIVNVSGVIKSHTVKILGNKVALTNNAQITSDGGDVLIGGNEHGAGPEQNASATYMSPDAVINNIDGKVILWSNDYTGFYGTINAPGGFVETSSHNNLQAFGSVNAATWLLDPRDITINGTTSGGSFSGGNPDIFTPTSDNAGVDESTINAALDAGTSVVITTGTTGTQNGDITLFGLISKSVNNLASLTLDAAGDINIGNHINFSTNSGDINFNAGGAINLLSEAIITTAGNFHAISTGDFNAVSQPALVSAGSVTINAGGAFNMDGMDISSTNGAVNISTGTGFNITNANVTTSHINAVGGDITITTPSIAIANGLINSGANNTNINITSGSPVTIDNSLPTLVTANSLNITATASDLNVNGLNVLAANIPTSVTLASSAGNVTFVTSPSTFNQNLVINAGGNIDSSAFPLSVTGTSLFTAGGNVVLTDVSNNLNGSVGVTANNATIDNANNLVISGANVTNNLILDATGSITQTGAISVGGASNFSAGSNAIDLTTNGSGNSFSGAITLNNSGVNNVSLTNSIATTLAASSVGQDLTIISGGAITQTGALNVGGASSFSAGGNDITLGDTANILTGAVQLQNANNTLVAANNDLAINVGTNVNNVGVTTINNHNAVIGSSTSVVLAASNVSGNLTVNAGVSGQTGALNIGGASTFTGGSNAIVLNNANNNFNGQNVSFTSASDVTLSTDNPWSLLASSVGGNFVYNGGSFSQLGGLSVTGTSIFNAGASDIALTNGNNHLQGAVSVTANNATIDNANNLIIGGANVANNLILNATGSITQTSAIHANSLTTNSVGGTILSNPNNQPMVFNATNTGGGDIVFNNNDPLTITGISQSGGGNVSINNIGSIDIVTNPIQTDGGSISIFSNSGTGPIFIDQVIKSGNASGGNLIIGQNVTFNGLQSNFITLGGGNITINIPLPPPLPPSPPDTNPINSIWWPPMENEAVCTGNGCASIEVQLALSDNGEGEPQVGVVNCVVGFAMVLDEGGNQRILAPGDKVYFNEKVVTDKMSSVTMRMDSGNVMHLDADKSMTMDSERA